MATTPTNNPIPSEDPRDLKFNAGKIDEEVNGSADYYTDRFSAQRLTNTGRNNQFQSQMQQQADDWVTQFNQQESDFQQFLLNSGYQFLGDYENGPYTISTRNQIVRYQNELWRLNAATNPSYTTTGVNSTSWAVDVTHLVSVGDANLRQELSSTNSVLGTSLVQHNAGNSLRAVLNRIKTLSDYGALNTFLGYNPTIDPTVFNDRQSDNQLLLPDSLHISKNAFGIRRYACGASIVINKGAAGFNAQVTGVSGSVALSTYNSADDVALQLEAYSEAYSVSEDISTVTEYGSNYFIASGLDFSTLKIGMICQTKHATPYWTMITGLDQANNKVTVDAFARNGVAVTPANDGSGIYINIKTKIWAANITSTLDVNSKAVRMTTLEIGFQNQKITSPSDSNGVDMVSLGDKGGTAAYFGRNTKAGNNWKNIFRGAGATEGTVIATNSTYGVVAPYGYVNNTAQGYISYGANVTFHSVVRDGGLTGDVLSGQDGSGRWLRNPTLLTVANGNYTISLNAGSVLHNAVTADEYTLPATPMNGEDIKILNPLNKSSLVIKTSDGSNTITRPDGVSVSSITVYGNQNIRMRYTGSAWFILGIQDRPFFASASITVASPIAVAAGTTNTSQTAAVSGVTLGMLVDVSCSADTLGLIVRGYVSSAGVVTVSISNVSGGSVSFPASTINVRVAHLRSYA